MPTLLAHAVLFFGFLPLILSPVIRRVVVEPRTKRREEKRREEKTCAAELKEENAPRRLSCRALSPPYPSPAPAALSRYFCDWWNRLDFITVVFGWAPLLLALLFGGGIDANLSFVRTVRVLKVLKSVQRVEGMRTLVQSLLKCAPLLLQAGRACVLYSPRLPSG